MIIKDIISITLLFFGFACAVYVIFSVLYRNLKREILKDVMDKLNKTGNLHNATH
jgi:hypothetical protein